MKPLTRVQSSRASWAEWVWTWEQVGLQSSARKPRQPVGIRTGDTSPKRRPWNVVLCFSAVQQRHCYLIYPEVSALLHHSITHYAILHNITLRYATLSMKIIYINTCITTCFLTTAWTHHRLRQPDRTCLSKQGMETRTLIAHLWAESSA